MNVDLTKTPSFRLDGRRALVTGAGRGIGLAAASALAGAGAHVTLAARTTKLYYSAASSTAARDRWQSLVSSYRKRVATAADDDELRNTLHALLRDRPPFRASASGRVDVRGNDLAVTVGHGLDFTIPLEGLPFRIALVTR